jgi:hypothetical protein
MTSVFFLVVRFELIELGAANRADPVFVQFVESGPGQDTIIRIAKTWIIDITTFSALPFPYFQPPFVSMYCTNIAWGVK